jgi:hypothetical protein
MINIYNTTYNFYPKMEKFWSETHFILFQLLHVSCTSTPRQEDYFYMIRTQNFHNNTVEKMHSVTTSHYRNKHLQTGNIAIHEIQENYKLVLHSNVTGIISEAKCFTN